MSDEMAFPGRMVNFPDAFNPGMTLRDYFAGQIACGMAAYSGTSGISYGPGDIAGRSYEVADAMLEARKK